MEFVEQVEAGIEIIAPLLTAILELTSILCITIGLLTTASLAVVQLRHRRRSLAFSSLRLKFGQWLALALEFQLGADIMATTSDPSFDQLGKLAIIAVIRTFLNYFLARELKEEGLIKDKNNQLNQNFSE